MQITYYDFEKNRTGSVTEKLINEYLAGNYSVAFYVRQSGKHIGQIDFKEWFREWYIEQAGEKCQICGWGINHPISGKCLLEIHHDDGNKLNAAPENLQVLCPNCHALTYNYKGHGRIAS